MVQKYNARTNFNWRKYAHFAPSCVKEQNSFGWGSVMMLAAISNDSETVMIYVSCNLTAQKFIYNIL